MSNAKTKTKRRRKSIFRGELAESIVERGDGTVIVSDYGLIITITKIVSGKGGRLFAQAHARDKSGLIEVRDINLADHTALEDFAEAVARYSNVHEVDGLEGAAPGVEVVHALVRDAVVRIWQRHVGAHGDGGETTSSRGFNLEDARHEHKLAVKAGTEERMTFLPFLGRDGYILRKGSTLCSSPPKAGKTETLVASVADWDGERVLWLSEEGEYIWVERAAVYPRGTFRHVNVEPCLGMPVDWMLGRIESGDETVVIVDTIRNLLDIENEIDNAQVSRALRPFIELCRRLEKTLILAHHSRKADGTFGLRVSGGNAYVGIVDVVLEIERDTGLPQTRRVLTGVARLFQPADLLYEQRGRGQIVALGSPKEVGLETVKERVLEVLPVGEDAAIKTIRVHKLLKADESQAPPSERTVLDALKELAQASVQGTGDDMLMTMPEVYRKPPISKGTVAGKTVRWWREA